MAPYYENPSLFPMKGGCACGLVRYTVTKPFVIVHCCHCTACQLQTGSAFAINAIVESTNVILDPPAPHPAIPTGASTPAQEALQVFTTATVDSCLASTLGGHDASYPNQVAASSADCHQPALIPVPSPSGVPQTIARCPRCCVAVWSHYGAGAGPHMAFVRAGTLDRAFDVEPDVHIYTRNRRAFFKVDDGKPEFDGFYPTRESVTRPDGMERYAAIWPAIVASAQGEMAKLGERKAARTASM